MANKRDYYEVLGVAKTATPEELKNNSTNPWVRQFFNRQAEPEMQKAAAN